MTTPHLDRNGARIRELVRARSVAEDEHDYERVAAVDAELETLGVRQVPAPVLDDRPEQGPAATPPGP